MITFETSGSFKRTEAFLSKMRRGDLFRSMDKAARAGVSALSSATPVDSGMTAASWSYNIKISRKSAEIQWTNSNTNGGAPIAIMLQYGHGTGTGGYVRGRDYINPAMRPTFDRIAEDVWKAVTSA